MTINEVMVKTVTTIVFLSPPLNSTDGKRPLPVFCNGQGPTMSRVNQAGLLDWAQLFESQPGRQWGVQYCWRSR